MPDTNFPEAKPSNGFYSVAQTVIGVEPKSRFSSFTDKTSTQDSWTCSWQDVRHARQQSQIHPFLKPLTFHAEPLTALRHRDEQALEDIFDDLQVEEILIDVCIRLRQLYPEPCWEDEPFDFLQGYL
ncbi:hypothetical protein SPB21_30240 [Leptothoe sp. ISB3NOV94-8A]|uniref:hypothetical protein n=1 Tax=Adonisia turfae TaxID=2950184 RepID=UPI002029B1C6|nr:hypothetical protein [Adonisia turfae]MDV3350401.1 hypothetical protein [Leptothoe sp. LEGE 181152]